MHVSANSERRRNIYRLALIGRVTWSIHGGEGWEAAVELNSPVYLEAQQCFRRKQPLPKGLCKCLQGGGTLVALLEPGGAVMLDVMFLRCSRPSNASLCARVKGCD